MLKLWLSHPCRSFDPFGNVLNGLVKPVRDGRRENAFPRTVMVKAGRHFGIRSRAVEAIRDNQDPSGFAVFMNECSRYPYHFFSQFRSILSAGHGLEGLQSFRNVGLFPISLQARNNWGTSNWHSQGATLLQFMDKLIGEGASICLFVFLGNTFRITGNSDNPLSVNPRCR